MRPANLKSKIFLDSGDANETRETIKLLGFLDGQTTNPTLIAKNPQVQKRLSEGKKFTSQEIFAFYKDTVKEISGLLPQGSVSIEVYADQNTTVEQMLEQGREMFTWIPNAYIKYPITKEGLTVAEKGVSMGMRVNMTLCFSQEQAAAVYSATKNTKEESLHGFKNVFLSPFIGRLDDIGENGMDFIKNVVKLYGKSDNHVELLAASVRTLDHFLASIHFGADIVTVPFKILKEWVEKGMMVPDENYVYNTNLKPIEYKELDLNKSWQEFDINHPLTEKGIQRFCDDWNNLVT